MNESVFVKKTLDFFKKSGNPFIKKMYAFDDLGSTNRTAKELALQNAREGTVVIAQTQSEGRGRFDRVWQSPKGGVYLSIILRPTTPVEKTSLLPFVAALAVAQAIMSYGLPARIKWPNDVLVNGKKIAGILLESETSGATLPYVVVGIGVNLNTPLSQLGFDIQKQSTTLRKEHGSSIEYYEFLDTLFQQFDRFYQIFSAGKFEEIVEEWKQHSDTLGKPIRVQTIKETVEGIADSVDQSGFLLLKTKDGKIVRVMSGDCTDFHEL
jgi:BirA family biotin operon repressor/biotin-[acetyl-CoA-carboxylase] ligase